MISNFEGSAHFALLGAEWHNQTHTQTDITNLRFNHLRGRLSENRLMDQQTNLLVHVPHVISHKSTQIFDSSSPMSAVIYDRLPGL